MAGPMDDSTFQAVVASRIRDAISYTEGDIATDRERATRFYRGDVSKELESVEGRSKVVSRDVRDVVLHLMPSFMRIFAGNERPVEFAPVGPEDEENAKQATDYANYVLRNDNPGFLILHHAIKDALVRRTGIIKVWWDDASKVSAQRFEGVDDATLQAHQETEGEITDLESEQVEGVDEMGQPAMVGRHSYTLKQVTKQGKVRVEAMPPDELVIVRGAKSFERPALIGHRKEDMRVGDLVAMGYDLEEMLELASDDEGDLTGEKEAREHDSYGEEDDDSAEDPAMRRIEYGEYYLLIDADGDGILEMRKVCTAGDAHKVLMQEVVDDHPFADLCPEPEPHTAIGLSIADCLDDIQLIRTQLLRLSLDGLGQVVTPRLEVDRSAGVDMKAVMDNRIGGVVSVGRLGGIQPIATDKAAPQMAMEAYRMIGELRQDRTGQNGASMGLEADALQSTSRIAANALVQAAQSRVEMIARIFAETGIKRMMKLILRLSTRHQDKERLIRLRNKFVPMDPRRWNPDMDVSINVGMGNGNTEERAMFLQSFLQIQQTAMQQLGPQNPLVSIDKVRNTLEDLCELGGKVPDRYLVSQEEWAQVQQQMAQQPPQPPKPDPAELIAQAEVQKVQAQIARDNAQAQFEMQRELLKDDRERDKVEADVVIRCLEKGLNPDAVLNIIRQSRQATPSVIPGGM